ncbi:DUF72 domain-containing protein [Mucilaginibacter sp. JRF]|nr:DUF72 domain-containing protein [Mucilaginibacter sp. JRF]MBE9584252.1 DUF72 domain-containing protein [Mucilaginibacter sp. JRF]
MGTSGLLTPIPKRDFPPAFQDKSRLNFYASLFNSIEINSSFYKLPVTKTLARWANEVPDGFRFTFKLWKQITHCKYLQFNPEDVLTFLERISSVGQKRGMLLVQLPPGLSSAAFNQFAHLVNILAEVTPDLNWPIAVEFRHRSWYSEYIYDFLDNSGTTMVIHDMPASSAPLRSFAAPYIYFRFHGPGGTYRNSYEDDFLSEYAVYMREFIEDGKMVYTYFNNTAGDALNNLKMLNSML